MTLRGETVALKTADSSSVKPDAKPHLKPEEQELARKLAEQASLEAELAERELRAASLRAELGAFERRYLHFVGSRYAELDEIQARLAEKAAREQPTSEPTQQAAREARVRANETRAAAGEKSAREPRVFVASPEMKRLYREVARRIHPDLAADSGDRARREQLMAEANSAYERGDEGRLSVILADYDSSPESVRGEGPGAELVRVIRRLSQIRSRLAEIETESQQLLLSDLCQLKVLADAAEKDGRDIFQVMVASVDEQIALARRSLENTDAKT